MVDKTAVEALNFETAYQELETIIEQLEGEDRSLEDMLALFERGQLLARRCEALLDQADLRVQQIVGGELQPFEQE